MRLVVPLAAAFLVAASLSSTAHAADAEIETIECSGTLDQGALTTPGYGSWTGTVSCVLGHGGSTGYVPYDEFTSNVVATIQNTPVASGAYLSGGSLQFADASRRYALDFYDPNALGTVALANPDDTISNGGPYPFHIREGYLRDGCTCVVGALTPGIHFVAEYVYDLPV